jgi:hypothetical protein
MPHDIRAVHTPDAIRQRDAESRPICLDLKTQLLHLLVHLRNIVRLLSFTCSCLQTTLVVPLIYSFQLKIEHNENNSKIR